MVYSVARAAVAEAHRLGSYTKKFYFLRVLEAKSLKSRWQVCSEAGREGSGPGRFSWACKLLFLPPRDVFSNLYLSTIFYKDISLIRSGPILMTSLNLITSIKTLSPNKVTS